VLINDVFNLRSNKQLSAFSRPHKLVIAFNYTTPGLKTGDGFEDIVVGGARLDDRFRTAVSKGELICVPASNNNLLTQLGRGPGNNPANWGGGTTFWLDAATSMIRTGFQNIFNRRP
jgi:hypothetical protein